MWTSYKKREYQQIIFLEGLANLKKIYSSSLVGAAGYSVMLM